MSPTSMLKKMSTTNIDLGRIAEESSLLIEELVKNPVHATAERALRFFQEVKRRYGEKTYAKLVKNLLTRYRGTGIEELISYLSDSKNISSVVEKARDVHRKILAREIYMKYGKQTGLTANDVAELIDVGGINVDRLAKRIRRRLERILGLAEWNADPQEIKHTLKEIKKLLRLGKALAGEKIVHLLAKRIGGKIAVGGRLTEPEELVKFFKHITHSRVDNVARELVEKLGVRVATCSGEDSLANVVKELARKSGGRSSTVQQIAVVEKLRHLAGSVRRS